MRQLRGAKVLPLSRVCPFVLMEFFLLLPAGFFVQSREHIDDLLAFVVAAILANCVRHNFFRATGTHRKSRLLELVVRPALAGCGSGMSHSDYHGFAGGR